MNMQYNAYEINKTYRKDQETRSEKVRLADDIENKKASVWFSPVMISVFVLALSGAALLSFFVWSFGA